MSDRELLEAAAKAAGIELGWDARGPYERIPGVSGSNAGWNPLTDDGDALRLAVKLNLFDENAAFTYELAVQMKACADPCEATRRAIVRAAAALGANNV